MNSSAQDATPIFSRLLLKRPGFYRAFAHPDGREGFRYDAESLEFLVGEFVSASAVEVAVSQLSPAAKRIGELPQVLRERFRVLDSSGESRAEHAALLAPIAREFQLEMNIDGSVGAQGDTAPQVVTALNAIVPGLYDFLLAARQRLQVDIDLPRLHRQVKALRALAKTPESRAHLAAIEGVLQSYKSLDVPALAFVTRTPEEDQRRFRDLVEDLAYRQLSADAALLGIPADAKRIVRLMARGLNRVMARPALAQGMKAATKAVMTSTGAPDIGVDFSKLLVPLGFFPPIISFGDVLPQAELRWREGRSDSKEIPRMKELLDAGWKEIDVFEQPTIDTFQGKPRGTFSDAEPS